VSLMLPAILTGASVPIFLTIVYVYFFLQDRERYLGYWAGSWLVYFLIGPLAVLMYFSEQSTILFSIDFSASFLSGFLLLRGTILFLEKKISRIWTVAFVAAAVWMMISSLFNFSFFLRAFPTFTFFGIVHIWAGSVVLRSKKVEGLGKYFTGWMFVLWGIHKIDFPFLRNNTAFAPWGYLIGGYCVMMLATGLLLIYFQRTRKALTESERKYRSLVTNIPDIAWRADSQGEILYISPNVYKIWGYTPEEIYQIGPNFLFERIHPDDLSGVREFRESLSCERGACNIEYRFKRKDGQWIWLHDKAIATDQEDGINYVDGVFSEVTDRKKAEKERESLIQRLHQALSQVKTLKGLLPICASCNKIKTNNGSWQRIEIYIRNRTNAEFSHSICPECAKNLYPEIY
jgi:PAS domain S-box-containing protein